MKINRNAVLSAVFSYLIASSYCAALTKDGVSLDDSIQSKNGSPLVLNGLGTRKATIFGIKVYVAGLYVSAKSDSPESIIDAKGEKQIHLSFIRDVDAADIRDAWETGFEKNNLHSERYAQDLKALLDSAQPAQKGQQITVIIDDEGVQILYPSGARYENKGAEFAKGLLRIWLGTTPPNAELKNGLLGRS